MEFAVYGIGVFILGNITGVCLMWLGIHMGKKMVYEIKEEPFKPEPLDQEFTGDES